MLTGADSATVADFDLQAQGWELVAEVVVEVAQQAWLFGKLLPLVAVVRQTAICCISPWSVIAATSGATSPAATVSCNANPAK